MKEITLRVPEKKVAFLLEIAKQLGFEIAQEVEIPEAHKREVRKRIKETSAEDGIPWEEARKGLKFK